MSSVDWAIAAIGGLVGWGVVSWLFTVIRQQRAPPVQMDQDPRAESHEESRRLSLADVSSTWHTILAVALDAGAEDIERAYHARIAECDRIRFSPTASPEDKKLAESRRAQIDQAFGFIRPLKH